MEAQAECSDIAKSILREGNDPHESDAPIPLWVVTITLFLVFCAGLYLAYSSGNFQADAFAPTRGAFASGLAAETGPADPMVLGKRVFTQNCIVCHQSTGLGIPGQFPPFVDSEWVLSKDWHGDNHLVKIVLYGMQGPVQVKGNTFNNVMPPQKLTDEQIAGVLTYIRNSWGNQAPPITVPFVKEIREETAGKEGSWTQETLQAIPPRMDAGKAEDKSKPAETPADPKKATPASEKTPKPA